MIVNDKSLWVSVVKPYMEGDGKRPSRGMSVAGYDFTLSNRFLTMKRSKKPVVYGGKDPLWKPVEADTIVLYPNELMLAVTEEFFDMPKDKVGIVLGKSTWARLGVLVNATPLEPGWKGHITIELSNLSPNPIRLIAGRGIGQVLLFDLAYPAEYEGIYQNQPKAPIPSCGQILRELKHIYEGWVRPTEK